MVGVNGTAEVPEHPLLEGLLGRPLDRVGGCQSGGGPHTPLSAPWRDAPREDDKTRLYQYVATPGGETAEWRLSKVVRDVFADGSPEYDNTDYRLAERFFRRYPEWFKTDRRDGAVWVEPTPDACRHASLDTASKHTVRNEGETTDSDGVALSNAKGLLGNRRAVEDAEVRGDLLGAFGAKRKSTEDRFHAFEDTFSPGSYRLIPYSTRFNSGRRVAETRDRYGTAWDRGREVGETPGTGVVATFTTDPGRYDSLLDAAEGLLDDVNRLKGWLSRSPENGPSRPGYRPPSLVVPEFTERGLPHVHVVFFGVGWLTTHAALSRYWDSCRNRGEVVWLDPIHVRGDRWVWGRPREDRQHPDTRGRTPREYLREGIDLLAESADATAVEVRESADALRTAGREGTEDSVNGVDATALDRGRDLCKAALYWGTELPVFTVSPELRADDGDGEENGRATAPDGTELPPDAPPRWRYVGTAQYGEFPPSIRLNAKVLTRELGPPQPPPVN